MFSTIGTNLVIWYDLYIKIYNIKKHLKNKIIFFKILDTYTKRNLFI